MYIYGSDFTREMWAKFTVNIEGGQSHSAESKCIYKSSEKLALEIPDIGEEVPVGHHPCNVEVSVNGQQFTNVANVTFLYNSIDRSLSEEDLKKQDEADEKAKGGAGKAPGKGKK